MPGFEQGEGFLYRKRSIPAVGVEGSEDSSPGVDILQHGNLLGTGPSGSLGQLAELGSQAVLNVQGLGILAFASLDILQWFHLHSSQGIVRLCTAPLYLVLCLMPAAVVTPAAPPPPLPWPTH